MKPEQIKYITWKEIVKGCVELASRIKRDQYKPDLIVSIVKGGVVPARILSDLLEVDEICFIGVRFYKTVAQRSSKPQLTFSLTCSVRDKNILVVDDVVETGRTLQLVIEELGMDGAKRVKTAAIYVKKWSNVMPDYYYMMVDKWIVFPWEIVEAFKNGIDISNDAGEDGEIYSLIISKILNN